MDTLLFCTDFDRPKIESKFWCIVIDIRSENVTKYKTEPADIITINKDSTTKTSSIVNGNGDTLFSLKGDSVLIDKIKSDTLNHR